MTRNLTRVVLLSASIFLFSFTLFNFQTNSTSSSAATMFVPAPRIASKYIGTYSICSSTSSCPIGVADYGVNGASTYSYEATTFTSWANFTALSIGTSTISCGSKSSGCMTIQQNLVDYNVYEKGSAGPIAGEYWSQDVASIVQSGSSFKITPEDNIWNFSSYLASMGGTIYADLLKHCAQYGGQPEYYYCTASKTITTTLPLEIRFTTKTGILSSGTHSGSSYVEFGIWVYHDGKLVSGQDYDEVAFDGKASTSPYFYVSGTTNNPYELNNDAETVMCGYGDGSVTAINSISASFTEAYIAVGSTKLTAISHAWSAGADTAETVSNVKMTEQAVGIGSASAGADNNNQLW